MVKQDTRDLPSDGFSAEVFVSCAPFAILLQYRAHDLAVVGSGGHEHTCTLG